jgi:hypothetical protein
MTKVSITVEPSAEHPSVLDVSDAMQQVLDFFEALKSDDDKALLVWNLTLAKTNSPFTAEATAVSLQPGVNVEAIALKRVDETASYFEAISEGRVPDQQISKPRRDSVRKLLVRNRNGVGRTTASFGQTRTRKVTVTPTIAERALASLEQIDPPFDLLEGNRKRVEVGSVEGILTDVTTDHKKPAMTIRERKSGNSIKVRIEPDLMTEISDAAKFEDVWEGRRVSVRGRIAFDDEGKIRLIHARSIRVVKPRDMTRRDVEDRGFTDGLPVAEYVDRLRDGELG